MSDCFDSLMCLLMNINEWLFWFPGCVYSGMSRVTEINPRVLQRMRLSITTKKISELVKYSKYPFFKEETFLGGHKSFLSGHWYPGFGLLVTSRLGFKARVDSLACMVWRLHATVSSESPLVRHLLTSWQQAWQLSCFIHIPLFHQFENFYWICNPTKENMCMDTLFFSLYGICEK